MSRVEPWKIRERDEQGRLVEAGFIWFERRPVVEPVVVIAALLLGIAALIAPIPLLAHGYALTAGAVAAAGFAGSTWLFRAYPRLAVRRRMLVFHLDGGMSYTYGMPVFSDPELLRSELPHADIVSIEASYLSFEHKSVSMFLSSGEALCVTGFQRSADDVRIIAVQLTLALEEIRASSGAIERLRMQGREMRDVNGIRELIA